MLWYFLLMLGMLWFWQEASHHITTRTIPYSQFKDLVAERRVADLTINETEITGKVLPKPAPERKAKPATPAETNALAKSESTNCAKTDATAQTKAASGTNAVAASPKTGQEKSKRREAGSLYVSHGSRGRPGPRSRSPEGGC